MKLTLAAALPCLVTAFAPVGHHTVAERRLPNPLSAGGNPTDEESSGSWVTTAASWATAACLAFAVGPAGAVSGGGLDYVNLDITGSTDFANANFKGKDFTQGESG